MPTALAAAQKRYLRTLAHPLSPVLLVGAKGVTPALLAELNAVLDQHELIKVRVDASDRDTRDAWIAALVKGGGAALVQRVGHVASLYRARPKDPAIVLPRRG
ncbi:MAG: ribosome assembly RNA-binding protein YhbY [Casimicrobiaceae bacterium]